MPLQGPKSRACVQAFAFLRLRLRHLLASPCAGLGCLHPSALVFVLTSFSEEFFPCNGQKLQTECCYFSKLSHPSPHTSFKTLYSVISGGNDLRTCTHWLWLAQLECSLIPRYCVLPHYVHFHQRRQLPHFPGTLQPGQALWPVLSNVVEGKWSTCPLGLDLPLPSDLHSLSFLIRWVAGTEESAGGPRFQRTLRSHGMTESLGERNLDLWVTIWRKSSWRAIWSGTYVLDFF